MKNFSVTDTLSLREDRLLLIAGPCQIESLDHALYHAETLKEYCKGKSVDLLFKASYDKANRTSISGARGVGIQEGLRVLEAIKSNLQLPVLTDVHSPEEVLHAASVVDVIQTPAFLCRQTDLLIAAGKSGKIVNVKKGQFLPPEDMKYCAEKISSTGNNNIMLCERGSCFGYRDLVVDMRGLVKMKDLGYPVIFDATHSVQSMGGAGGASSGARQYVVPLLKAALAVGVNGVFIECHRDPDNAPSDGPNMIPLSEMPKVIDIARRLFEASRECA